MNSSPIGMYSPKDYYNAALRDYTNWCARKYGDDEFTEAFLSLQKHKLGVDLIEETEVQTLISLSKVLHGTAVRLRNNIEKWIETL